MRKMVLAATAVGLIVTAGCGKVGTESNSTSTTSTTTSTSIEIPFNAGLCQTGLDAKKGANATVPPGGCVISPAKTYAMVMSPSGELKVAAVSPAGGLGATIWTTNTHAASPGSASTAWQEDGNLVIYDQPGNKPIWASGSSGPLEPYHLSLTDEGDLVATRVSSGKTVWSSKSGLAKPDAAPAPAAVDATPANTTT